MASETSLDALHAHVERNREEIAQLRTEAADRHEDSRRQHAAIAAAIRSLEQTVRATHSDCATKAEHAAQGRRISSLEITRDRVRTAARVLVVAAAPLVALFNFDAVSEWIRGLLR